MSTSSGASPSTMTRQPVARRSQAGSSSVVQYHVARKRRTGRPSRIPDTVRRCAATVPASSVPAAISTCRVAVANSPSASTESSGIERASATSWSEGPKLMRPYDSRPSSNAPGGRPYPITSKRSPGESRDERSAQPTTPRTRPSLSRAISSK